MVYLRMTPFGLWGGNQDTTTLLREEGTALIPAGGPGTVQDTEAHQQGRRVYACTSMCDFCVLWTRRVLNSY